MRTKKYVHLVFCSLSVVLGMGQVFAQTVNDNYVKTYKALKGIAGDLSTINDKTQVQESIEYYDGLGRPLQSIGKQASPLGYDVVTLWVYDEYGRKATSYLPYVSTSLDGNLKNSALEDQTAFYQNQLGATDGSFPFSTQVFENSELQRVLKISSPGAPWQPNPDPFSLADNTVKKRYEFNGENDVIIFSYDPTTQLVTKGLYYAPNQLYANKTTDEQGHEVIEYVDKEGRTICKKVEAGNDSNGKVYASTYYVYDDLGNLVAVLPPEGVKELARN